MAMMTKSFIRDKVCSKVAEEFKNEGFKYIKSKEHIIRKHNIGFDVIFIRVIDYNPIFQLESSVAVRINEVENIVNLFYGKGFMNPVFHPLTTTTSTSYRALTGSNKDYFEVSSEMELIDAMDELIIFITSVH